MFSVMTYGYGERKYVSVEDFRNCADRNGQLMHESKRYAAEIESLKAQLAECRDKALEEAAARCEAEDVGHADRFECADEIRLLKGI